MSENPYQPPEASADSPPAENRFVPDQEPFPYYVPIVQFGLRLLGVYIFAVGATYLVQNILEFMILLTEPPLRQDPRVVAYMVGNGLYAGIGAYLCLGGNWIIEKLFLPLGNRAPATYD